MRTRPVGPARRSPYAVSTALTAAMVLTGCGASSSGSGSGKESGTLTVLGASSLTETFTTLAKDFEAAHPGVKVKLAFDSSATLAEQVDQGAPADVLATADTTTMQTVRDSGGVDGTAHLFATNHLQLAVPRKNPAGITRFSDLGKPGVKLVVCVATAPCGKLAAKVLASTGIATKPVSEEVDVKAVLSKVQLDEADAGLVYATDAVAAAGKVTAIDVPTTHQNLNSYPVAVLKEAKKPALARAWVDLVLSAKGQKVLRDAGFGQP